MLRFRFSVTFILLSFVGMTEDASAQNSGRGYRIPPGTLVRIWAPEIAGEKALKGPLVSLNQDAIVIRRKNPSTHIQESYAVPMLRVQRLEMQAVYHKDHEKIMKYIKIVGIGGLALGAFIGFAVTSDSNSHISDDGTSGTFDEKGTKGLLLGALIGGAGGVLIGAAIGSTPVHRWEKVDLVQLRRQLHVGFIPSFHGRRGFPVLSCRF